MEQNKNSFKRDLNLDDGVTPTEVWRNYRTGLSLLTDNILNKIQKYKELNTSTEN